MPHRTLGHIYNAGGRTRRYRLISTAPAVALAAVAGMVLLAPGAARAAKSGTTLATFDTPGTYAWTVPHGVKQATFDVFGAQGGGSGNGWLGGLGGEATATFNVRAGDVYEIAVGGAGQGGGFNGGGDGWTVFPFEFTSGFGGGATDVRSGDCAPVKVCGFESRILVAGGGGGAAHGGAGGSGGGLFGGGGSGPNCCSLGGTSTSGGAAGPGPVADSTPGTFGSGGNGSPGNVIDGPGAGGGGGWFGGGGGGPGSSGGGGSGFIGPFAVSGAMQTGVQTGDGSVVISKG